MIRFRPAAARELAADIRYYEKQYEGRGEDFAEAIERALVRIAELPTLYPILYGPDIRSAKVNRFPYRIIFIAVDGDIVVVAVAHAKRRPAYWRPRTK